VGLSHCRHYSLVTVRDKARLRQGHNEQSRRGHQCSETTLTGESRFHISTPLGIEPRSVMTGSKRVVHWTSETWCECSEIASSPQIHVLTIPLANPTMAPPGLAYSQPLLNSLLIIPPNAPTIFSPLSSTSPSLR
jgi:hypothetical protein